MAKEVKVVIKADGSQAQRELQRTAGELDIFSKSTVTAGAAIGAIALTKLAADTLAVNTEYQRLNASLITVTGNSINASNAFAGLTKFATETPFQVQEVVEAFVKLKALGLDPSEQALRSYGNTASAMGKSLNQVIEAVADATTGEFERLKEFGIKARSEGENVTFTFNGIKTTIRKDAAEIEEYIRQIGDVKFAGAMAEQMNTLGGAISNLSDNYDGFLRAIGDRGANAAAAAGINLVSEALRELTNLLAPSTENQIDSLDRQILGLREQLDMLGKVPAFLKLFYPSDTGLEEQIANLEQMRAILESPSIGPNIPAGGRPNAATQAASENDQLTELQLEIAKDEEILALRTEFAAIEYETLKDGQDRAFELWFAGQQLKKQLLGEETDMWLLKEQGLTEITAQETEQRLQLAQNQLDGTKRFLGDLSTLQNSHSRKAFELGKAASVSNAIVNTYEGVTGAYTFGAKIGGPPLGAAFGTAALAAGLTNVRAIESQKFGGGGISVSGSSGFTGSTTTPVVSQPVTTPQPTTNTVSVTILGNVVDHDKFAREVIPSIQKAFADGVA